MSTWLRIRWRGWIATGLLILLVMAPLVTLLLAVGHVIYSLGRVRGLEDCHLR